MTKLTLPSFQKFKMAVDSAQSDLCKFVKFFNVSVRNWWSISPFVIICNSLQTNTLECIMPYLRADHII